MGKHGSTKSEILELIGSGHQTLSEISEALGLAPSTVSKHIQDLEASGAIVQKENSHVKKWKYYMLNGRGGRGTETNGTNVNSLITNRATTLAIVSIALVVAFSAAAYYALVSGSGTGAATVSGGTAYVPISITDPPKVPMGTQALYINYSSLVLTLINNGTLQTMDINASGKLDLLSLINESQVIGEVAIPTNSVLREVTFNISSASIEIDNTSYSVQVQDNQVSAYLPSPRRFNSTSGILLDFSPIVYPVYGTNQTEFQMLASVSASVIPNQRPQNGQGFMPMRAPVPQNFHMMFPGPNLTVSGTASEQGSNLTLRIALKNNEDRNLTVLGVALDREQIGFQMNPMQFPFQNSNFTNPRRQRQIWQQNNSTVVINASQIQGNNTTINLPMPAYNIIIGGGFGHGRPWPAFGGMNMQPTLGFMANSNGTLSLPVPMMRPPQNAGGIGYTVDSMANGTLSYGGQIPFMLQQGNYTLTLLTNEGAIQQKITVT